MRSTHVHIILFYYSMLTYLPEIRREKCFAVNPFPLFYEWCDTKLLSALFTDITSSEWSAFWADSDYFFLTRKFCWKFFLLLKVFRALNEEVCEENLERNNRYVFKLKVMFKGHTNITLKKNKQNNVDKKDLDFDFTNTTSLKRFSERPDNIEGEFKFGIITNSFCKFEIYYFYLNWLTRTFMKEHKKRCNTSNTFT